MSENAAVAAEPTSTEAAEPAEVDWKAKYEDAKKQSRTWESRAKENLGAKSELDFIRDSQKSAEQRAADERAALQRERDEARSEALRYRIATQHKISDEDASVFLTGADEETLTRQAERLAQLTAVQAAVTDTRPGPRPDLSQGVSSAPIALNGDPLEQALREKLGI